MKKIVFIALLSVFSLSTVNAQAKKTKKAVATKIVTPKVPVVEGAGMVFENEIIIINFIIFSIY